MPTGYQIVEQSKTHYLTFYVVYWIDVFSRRAYRDLFLESLAYCRQHKSLEVYGYVIMTNRAIHSAHCGNHYSILKQIGNKSIN